MGCNRFTTNHKGGPKTKWLQAQNPWLEHRALRWVRGRRASPSPGHCPGTTNVDRSSPTARAQASCHFEPTQACIYRYAGNMAAGDSTPQPETSETLPPKPLSLSPLLWEQGTLFQFPTSCKVIMQSVGKEPQNRLEKMLHVSSGAALHSSVEGVCKRLHNHGARLWPRPVAVRQSLYGQGARPHPLAKQGGLPLSPGPRFPAKLTLPLQLSSAPTKQQGSQES